MKPLDTQILHSAPELVDDDGSVPEPADAALRRLREPLDRLRMLTEEMRSECQHELDGKMRRYLGYICEAAEDMGRLIENVLDDSEHGRDSGAG